LTKTRRPTGSKRASIAKLDPSEYARGLRRAKCEPLVWMTANGLKLTRRRSHYRLSEFQPPKKAVSFRANLGIGCSKVLPYPIEPRYTSNLQLNKFGMQKRWRGEGRMVAGFPPPAGRSCLAWSPAHLHARNVRSGDTRCKECNQGKNSSTSPLPRAAGLSCGSSLFFLSGCRQAVKYARGKKCAG